jgi:acetyltransferase-like isoleucine patch superfamily enzyme
VSTSHPLRGSIVSLANRVFVRERVLRRSTLTLGRVWIHGEGEVFVDEDVILDARWAPIELHAAKGARITIGRGARIDAGASLEALTSITVGAGATLGAFCKIMDNHFHQIDRDHRLPPSRPVSIGAGAVVGERAILLPGASVANGATVPPGAVVTRRFGGPVPSDTSAAGAGVGADRLPIAQDRSYVLSRSRVAKVRAAIAVLRASWYLRRCHLGRHVHAGGAVAVVNEGEIAIGSNAVFVGGMIPTGLVCARGATLRIGARTIFNYGVSLTAARSVTIGERCQFGSLVRVHDRDGMAARPIVIGDDVWVAHGATIAPGVTIGSRSVISAGTSVTEDVPADSLVIGSPMRCMSMTLRSDRAGERMSATVAQ